MNITPVTVLDNFFDDPDSIRTWALTQEFFSDPLGNWPGKRTKPLGQLNSEFLHFLSSKFITLFYNFDLEKVNWQVDAMFQLVDKDYGAGWVHDDGIAQITGLVYLTPGASLKSGTSIFRKKSELAFSNPINSTIKNKLFQKNIPLAEAEEYRLQNNEIYEETINISNVYNRLVSFDSNLHHAAQDFFVGENETRLTLIFFVNQLLSTRSPVLRSRTIR